MSTIDVNGHLVLHQDDVFAFQDETGFLLEGDGSPELVNEGRISLAKSAANPEIAVIASLADNAVVWNQATGTIHVQADDDGGFGIWAQGAGTTLRNDGRCLFEATGSIVGVLASGVGTRFINNGVWRVQATESAGGGYLFCDEAVNAGKVSVSSSDDAAFGFYAPGGGHGQFTNSGLIKVVGLVGATGVSLYDAWPNYLFVNTGRIVASSAGLPSMGILTPAVGAGVIENAGLIRADHAIWSAYSDMGQTIINSGKVVGDVLLEAAPDVVTNTGIIRGEVDLGDGWDRYDGRGGVLQGVLWGGFGDDTLIGGRGGEEIHGDDAIYSGFFAADLLKGGGGDDTLYGGGGADTLQGGKGADFLYGEDGADLMDGGKGADVYVFTALSQSAPDGADTIAGWHGDDWIDLSSIDADADTPGDQAFAPDQVTVSFDGASGQTRIELDADRDGTADFVLIIASGHFSLDHLVL